MAKGKEQKNEHFLYWPSVKVLNRCFLISLYLIKKGWLFSFPTDGAENKWYLWGPEREEEDEASLSIDGIQLRTRCV